MDKQSPPKADQPWAEKIFFLVFFLLIAGSVGATYYRYVVAHDYIIQAEMECDPYTEACFTYVCDLEADEECTGDPVEDTSYYKLISRNAKNVPLCDPVEAGCEALTCPEGEADCTFTLCDSATAEDGVECNDPVAYTFANPLEDEELSGEDETGEEIDGAEEDESAPMEEELIKIPKPSDSMRPADAAIQQ